MKLLLSVCIFLTVMSAAADNLPESAYEMILNHHYEKAIQYCDEGLKNNSNDLQCLFYKGLCLMFLDKQEDAQKIFRDCLEIWPDFKSAVLALADSYSESGRHNSAALYYEKSLRFPWPQTTVESIHIKLISSYTAAGNYKKAEFAAERFSNLNANLALSLKGHMLYNRKFFEDAAKLFISSFEANRKDKIAAYNAACCLALSGKTQEALSYLTSAMLINDLEAQTVIPFNPQAPPLDFYLHAQNDPDLYSLKKTALFRYIMDKYRVID